MTGKAGQDGEHAEGPADESGTFDMVRIDGGADKKERLINGVRHSRE